MSKIIKFATFERNSPIIIKHNTVPEVEVESSATIEEAEQPEIDLEALQKEAEGILAAARSAAAQCLAEAELKSEELSRQAYDTGLKEGYQAGFEQGLEAARRECEQSLEAALEQTKRLIEAAKHDASQMVVDAERQIVEVALAVARKLLAREIEENPTVILPIVTEALQQVYDQEQIVIRVNPEDYDMVIMAKRDLQLMIGRQNALNVTADLTISPGGCIIDTASGSVDARLDTKLEIVYKAIQEVLP